MTRKSLIAFVYSLITISTLISCAGVKLYTAADGNKSARLKFYYSQPYLLVEENPEKEVAQKMSIIYLPDLENPVYAEQKRGLGSSDLQVSYQNGSISSFGLTTDSKMPEALTSIAGLIPAVIAKGPIEATAEGDAKPGFALYKIQVSSNGIILSRVKVTN